MSARKDSLRVLQLTIVFVGGLIALSSGLHEDRCSANTNEEDCLDASMHPVLPQTPKTRALNNEYSNDYWIQMGKAHVRKQARRQPNTKIAKNIILFLGDGMGLTTFSAARNLLGGEERQLSFETFPYTGFAKTYSVNTIVPDSACTATAYLCGIKANYGTIGVNAHVQRGDCEAMANEKNHVHSLAKWALDAGKAAGLVTTTRVTHASPAGVYAHVADRDWENDRTLRENCGANSQLSDIAQQLIHGEVGSQLKVILGGGKREFLDKSVYSQGNRSDGRDLIEDFLTRSENNVYVETKEQLFNVNPYDKKRVLGLFHDSHLDYHLDVVKKKLNKQPTLEEMTKRAIEFMQHERYGYFLFIEGGRIDTAHHRTEARVSLDETVEFAKAVETAINMTSEENTLIVVTADHSHTFSVAGYQPRGSDIFGVTPVKATDDKPYLSLSYANGPSFDKYFNTNKNARRNPQKVSTESHDSYPATAPLDSETHGGEDVAVFASGPWSHLFTGVYEQNVIPHMMAYAACVGDGLKAC